MGFTHSAVHDLLRAAFNQPPANFDLWQTPPGGDRIWARRYSGGNWSAPIAVTAGGEDLYRPAVAVDGQGVAWVFWSAQNGGDFDLWARPIVSGTPGGVIRITSEAGSDIDPVAATDSSGRVWIAWQAWRNGRASIFAARQSGFGFTPPVPVGSSTSNEWNPAIAADTNGRVTVAWDSYRNRNYDVYLRTAQNNVWGNEIAAATSARYEAYPSLAYAPNGRLWLAFEQGHERWGKDWGAYETSGVALYIARAVRVLGFETSGQRIEPLIDVGTVLPGGAGFAVELFGRQSQFNNWLPQPQSASQRAPNQYARRPPAPRNTSPRLHVDNSGRLWLAFRTNHPLWSSYSARWGSMERIRCFL